MTDLSPDVQIRAAAVQAAASILGGDAYMRGAYSGMVIPTEDLQQLTSRIGMYIKHGSWTDDL
jgi:hypothetical protein